MFNVHHANDVGRLADLLANELREHPAGALEPETIVVPVTATGRWLSYALADRLGIAALHRYALPGACVWSLMARVLPDLPADSPLDAGTLTWRLASLLAPAQSGAVDDATAAAFLPVTRWLARGGVDARIELAGEIARVFERYATHRPHWLEAWLAGRSLALGEHEVWQAQLFRSLAAGPPALPALHPSHEFFRALDEDTALARRLPSRISLFALLDLPRPYLDFFTRLGGHLPVTLYLLNPCREYWGHVVTERRRLRAEVEAPALAAYLESGNRLFASLSQHGRALFDALANLDAPGEQAFVDPAADTLLARLQRDILDLRDPTDGGDAHVLARNDHSVRIDVCHGPVREAEVLHDRLLALFEADPTLRCEDVLVLTPDITVYGGAIEAVFSSVPASRHIPLVVTGRTTLAQSPAALAIDRILAVLQGRLTAEEVLGLLAIDPVRERFGIARDDAVLIRDRVAKAGIRWGEDEQARARLALPATRESTWRAGLDRLLFGLALGRGTGTGLRDEGSDPFGDIVPFTDIEGGVAVVLGRFIALVEQLFARARDITAGRTMPAWSQWLAGTMEALLAPAADDEGLYGALRAGIAGTAEDAARAGFGESVPFRSFITMVRAKWSGVSWGGRLGAGGVTVTELAHGRIVPARVICLVGMNDGAFPRREVPREFDLMLAARQAGDPSRRDADRYAFLIALASARTHLIVTYAGRDIRTDQPRPPSVVVTELLEAIGRTATCADGASPVSRIVAQHPLQPFSARYGKQGGPETYATEWHPEAESREVPFVEPTWRVGGDPVRAVDLEDLLRFWRNPAQWFLRRRAGLTFEQSDDVIPPAEPLTLDGRTQFMVRDRVVRARLSGSSAAALPEAGRMQLQANGVLPGGAAGLLMLNAVTTTIGPLGDRIAEVGGQGAATLDIDLTVDDVHITGALDVPLRGDRVEWRPGRLRAVDLHAAWIGHVVWSTLMQEPGATWIIGWEHGKPVSRRIGSLSHDVARAQLSVLVRRFVEGQHRPLPFYPESGWAYVTADPEEAASKAREAWSGSAWNQARPEGADPWMAAVARGRGLDDPFVDLAQEVLGPLNLALQ